MEGKKRQQELEEGNIPAWMFPFPTKPEPETETTLTPEPQEVAGDTKVHGTRAQV